MTPIRKIATVLLTLPFAAALTADARAQYGVAEGAVTGIGVVSINRQPERMRVQIILQAKGSTLKEALAALKTRSDSARKQLTALGADKDSIKLDGPRIGSGAQNDNQNQMRRMQMRMMAQMKKQAGAKEPKKDVPDPVLVTATIKAELKLDAKAPDDLLLASHALQEKIRAADLGGTKEGDKLSPEEEELLEEQQGEMMNFGNDNEAKPGEPVFFFVSKISEADRDKAMAEAFQKAKAQAQRMAKAAGIELGALKGLTANGSGAQNAANYNYAYNSRVYRAWQMAQQMQNGDGEDTDEFEALGVEAGPLKFNVTVTASFDAKTK